MKALLFKDKLNFVDDYPMPTREKNEALIRIKLAGICNTDREIMKGYKNFHGVLGHEYVGIVEDADNKSLIGKRVVGEINIGCGKCEFCKMGMPKHCYNRKCLGITGKDGCFSEYITMGENTLFIVPDDITDKEALFSEPLAAAYSAVKDAHLKDDDKILILGDGRLAYLIYVSLVYYLMKNNYSVGYIDKHLTVKGHNKDKLEMFEHAIKTLDISDKSKYFNVVFEATGSESGINEAILLTKPRGKIVIKTTHEGNTTLDLNTVVVNELTLIGSRCGDFNDAIKVLETHPKLPETVFFDLSEFEKAFSTKAFKVGFSLLK